NEVNLGIICHELQQQNDGADREETAVILYTVNIQSNGENTCNKSEIYVETELFLTDISFHRHSVTLTSELSRMVNRKLKFMEEYYEKNKTNLEEWQQLLQIETIEFLLKELAIKKNYSRQKLEDFQKRLDSIKKEFYELKTSKRNAHQQIQGGDSSSNPPQIQGEASSSDPQEEHKEKKMKLFGVYID
uniref:Uncharacterized protein n=1 Tax=Meloidogyne floridensis TaxID=298350 RepID=A0A915NXE3_9BILA